MARREAFETLIQRELRRYINMCGSRKEACFRLNISTTLLSHWMNGHRTITPDRALKIEADSRKLQPADPVDKAVLIWGSNAYL